LEHDLFRKTGIHFSGSCSNAADNFGASAEIPLRALGKFSHRVRPDAARAGYCPRNCGQHKSAASLSTQIAKLGEFEPR
jgi:hypothetical protein